MGRDGDEKPERTTYSLDKDGMNGEVPSLLESILNGVCSATMRTDRQGHVMQKEMQIKDGPPSEENTVFEAEYEMSRELSARLNHEGYPGIRSWEGEIYFVERWIHRR